MATVQISFTSYSFALLIPSSNFNISYFLFCSDGMLFISAYCPPSNLINAPCCLFLHNLLVTPHALLGTGDHAALEILHVSYDTLVPVLTQHIYHLFVISFQHTGLETIFLRLCNVSSVKENYNIQAWPRTYSGGGVMWVISTFLHFIFIYHVHYLWKWPLQWTHKYLVLFSTSAIACDSNNYHTLLCSVVVRASSSMCTNHSS